MEFKGDEAVAIQLAMPMVEGRELPRVGLMSSVGVHNPPLFIWLVAAPAWISVDPIFVTLALVALLAVLAVAGTWWVLRRHLGVPGALAVAAIYATATWPVLYGRKLWAQDVLPLFSLLLLYALLITWERKKTRWVAAVPILLCVLWQLHFSALGLMIVAAGLLLARARAKELSWLSLGAGVVAALLMMGPYLHFQVEKGYPDLVGFANIAKGQRADGTTREAPKRWSLDPLRWMAHASSGTNVGYAVGRSKDDHHAWRSGLTKVLSPAGGWLGNLLLGAGALLALWASVLAFRRRSGHRGPPDRAGEIDHDPHTGVARSLLLVVAAWVLGFVLVFTLLRLEHVWPHYFIILYPAPFVLMWLPLAWIARRFGQKGAWLAGGATTVIVLAHLTTLLSLGGYVNDRGGTGGDYGVSYEHKADLVDYVVANGLMLHRPPGFEYGFLVRTARAYGDIDEITAAAEGRPAPPRSHRRLRVWDSLRYPRAAGFKCSGRQDFGPLVTCPLK